MTVATLATRYVIEVTKSTLWTAAVLVAVLLVVLFVLALTRHAAAASFGYRLGLERGRQEAPAEAKIRADGLLVKINRLQADYDRVCEEKQDLIEENAEIRGLARRMLQQARRDANRMIDNMGNRDDEIEQLVSPKGKRRTA